MKYAALLSAMLIFAIFFCKSLSPEDAEGAKAAGYTLSNIYLSEDNISPITAIYSDKLAYAGTSAKITFIKNTDALPRDFMLTCLSEGKTPYIVIEEGSEIFELDHIKAIAQDLRFYNTECCVELYPVYSQTAFNFSAYRSFFKNAAEIFRDKAPKTKIVWAVSPDIIYEEAELAPPLSSFDYIGLSVICGLNGDFALQRVYAVCEYLNLAYPKPIIITRFAAADYSEKSHSYYKGQKVACIREVVKNLTDFYPNIAGIIVYESSSYMYGGYSNRLSFSNDDEAAALLLNALGEFQKKETAAKKLPYTALTAGSAVYVYAEDYPKISDTPYTAIVIDGEKYINLSRTQKTSVSVKNRAVIIFETVI